MSSQENFEKLVFWAYIQYSLCGDLMKRLVPGNSSNEPSKHENLPQCEPACATKREQGVRGRQSLLWSVISHSLRIEQVLTKKLHT